MDVPARVLLYRNKLFFRTDNFAVNIQPSRGLVVVPWTLGSNNVGNDDIQLPGLDKCKKMVES